MLSSGDSERLLIGRELERLARLAKSLTLRAMESDDRQADTALDAGWACAQEAERLRLQLDRAKRNRPERGGRSR